MVLVDGRAYCQLKMLILLKLLAQIIQIWAHFLDYSIKSVRVDNECEVTFKAFGVLAGWSREQIC